MCDYLTTGNTFRMTRSSSHSKGSSYQVTSPQYRQGVHGYQYPVGYSTRPPSKYEMSEFTATNHYVTSAPSNGKNGHHSARVVPINGNGTYNGKHQAYRWHILTVVQKRKLGSVVGSVILFSERLDFENGLRTVVLRSGLQSACTTL